MDILDDMGVSKLSAKV